MGWASDSGRKEQFLEWRLKPIARGASRFFAERAPQHNAHSLFTIRSLVIAAIDGAPLTS
jgi:hypothetical protein